MRAQLTVVPTNTRLTSEEKAAVRRQITEDASAKLKAVSLRESANAGLATKTNLQQHLQIQSRKVPGQPGQQQTTH
jgi:hypothetical protein